MTDQEFEEMLRLAKRLGMRVVRPCALGVVAYFLSTSQGHFIYPNLVVALLVVVFSASSYGAKWAYLIVMYLALLVFLPPEFFVNITKIISPLFSKTS